MKFNVPFIKPSLPHGAKIAEDYEKIVENNWFTNFGPFEKEFCTAAAAYLGNGTHVTTVASATLGIDLAIRALVDTSSTNNSPKSMLMPSFTFAAGALAIITNGMTPVFIDIRKDSLQPNIEEAEKYIEKNRDTVAGILLCNVFGVGNAQIDKWEELAGHYNLPLIIDTAAGFGSHYNVDEKVGSRGDCEVFSLHATKPFAVGEGGLVSSKNKETIDRIRSLQNFGFGEDRRVSLIGTNAKMQEINAAIGLRQLEGFEHRIQQRRSVLEKYKMGLSNYEFQDNDILSTVPFASAIAKDPETAARDRQNLIACGVEARNYYEPLHLHALLASKAKQASDLTVTEDVAQRIISLPVHDDMDSLSIQKIIGAMEGV